MEDIRYFRARLQKARALWRLLYPAAPGTSEARFFKLSSGIDFIFCFRFNFSLFILLNIFLFFESLLGYLSHCFISIFPLLSTFFTDSSVRQLRLALLLALNCFIVCRNETHQVVRYLEHCVHSLDNEDPGIHNLLLSLYSKQVAHLFLTTVSLHKILVIRVALVFQMLSVGSKAPYAKR